MQIIWKKLQLHFHMFANTFYSWKEKHCGRSMAVGCVWCTVCEKLSNSDEYSKDQISRFTENRVLEIISQAHKNLRDKKMNDKLLPIFPVLKADWSFSLYIFVNIQFHYNSQSPHSVVLKTEQNKNLLFLSFSSLSPEVPVHPLAQHCILKRTDKRNIQADSPELCRIHPDTNSTGTSNKTSSKIKVLGHGS